MPEACLGVKDKHMKFAYSILNPYQSHFARDDDDLKADTTREDKNSFDVPATTDPTMRIANESIHRKGSSDYEDLSDTRWKLGFASLSKALQPVLEFWKRAVPGNVIEDKIPLLVVH